MADDVPGEAHIEQPQDGTKVIGIVGRRQLMLEEGQAKEAIGKIEDEKAKGQCERLLQLQIERNQKFYEYLIELRNLEIKYEGIYQPFYQERVNTLQGREGFWLQVMKNNASTARFITERDEEVLNYLVNIRSVDDPTCDNYTIEFEFASGNPFFTPIVLTKIFTHDEDQLLDEAVGTEITWKKGKDITCTTKKQKIKTKTVTITEQVNSFFHFFTSSSTAKDDEELEKTGMYKVDLGHKEIDEELGVEFRDEIIPHALLYYLGVRKRVLKEDKDEKEDSQEESKAEGDEETPEEEAKSPPPRSRK